MHPQNRTDLQDKMNDCRAQLHSIQNTLNVSTNCYQNLTRLQGNLSNDKEMLFTRILRHKM